MMGLNFETPEVRRRETESLCRERERESGRVRERPAESERESERERERERRGSGRRDENKSCEDSRGGEDSKRRE